VRRGLLPHVVGRHIRSLTVHQPQLRELIDVASLRRRLMGQHILGVRRRAKYLLFDLSADSTLMVHLGMSGRLGIVPTQRQRRLHDHLIIELDDGHALCLNDARRFGLVCCFARDDELAHRRLRHLGVEPLDPAAFTAAWLQARTRGCKKPIKNYLMDATHQVGVGNIYACEALFAARIHPVRAAGRLSAQRCARLVEAVVTVLREAIELGGTTLRDFANVDGAAGFFAPRLQVYGRTGQACLSCGGPIRRLVQAGRSTFFCPGCQH
jgi:formamidopyrimidine-DNA glycosylase